MHYYIVSTYLFQETEIEGLVISEKELTDEQVLREYLAVNPPIGSDSDTLEEHVAEVIAELNKSWHVEEVQHPVTLS